MVEIFEDRDLSDAVFWGVHLQRSKFRDANLSNSSFFHTLWKDVSIDGVIQGLVVNGVDVTDYVNANDRWYPLRTQLEPSSADELRATWSVLQAQWSEVLSRVAQLEPEVARQSVGGQWSLRDTLRHLLFAMDKWFFFPLGGEQTYTAMGLPNSESQHLDWPGLDLQVDPDFAEVLRVRSEKHEIFTNFIKTLDFEDLAETVDVGENGQAPSVMCFHVVLEEEFEHLRYVLRDLDLATRRLD